MSLNLKQISDKEDEYQVKLYPKRGIALAKGEGSYLFDIDGKQYIDCMTNLGVNILGYGESEIADAIAKQLQQLPSTHQSFYSKQRAVCLETFTKILPKTLNKIVFTNSGAESVEAAIKLARAATGKTQIIAMNNSYHGRTLGALSATGQEKYKIPFLPLLPGFTHVSFNNLMELKKAITNETAAVLLEPIQGEGGVIIPEKSYLKNLAKLARQKGILIIMDEIQTGIRTGSWLASEDMGIVPDIVCLSKSLSYGLPFGIVATNEDISEKMPKGGHGSTFAGNPVSCVAAFTVIQLIQKNNLLTNAQTIGDYFIKKLQTFKHPSIKQIRGKGLMIAIEFTEPSTPYVQKMQQLGLLAIPSGNVIRLLPPITFTKQQVDEVINILKKIFK